MRPRTASTRLDSAMACSKLPVTPAMAAIKRLPNEWPFSNLFIAAMAGVTGNFEDVYKRQGVERFKSGFGGDAVRYAGAYDYVYSPLVYRAFNWVWGRRRARARQGQQSEGEV